MSPMFQLNVVGVVMGVPSTDTKEEPDGLESIVTMTILPPAVVVGEFTLNDAVAVGQPEAGQ